MKKSFLFLLMLIIGVAGTQQLNAQIAFSMVEELANQNTPEGWKTVELPQDLPIITAANTFDITASPYNASTTSEDNTSAIQAALNAAASAGGGIVVIPAGTFLTGCLQMGSKTILHLCEGATLKLKAIGTFPIDGNGYHKMDSPFITGKNGASDIVIEGESRTLSIIDGQGAPWWDEVEAAKTAGKSTTRNAMIRFWQGSRYLFRNFCMQNTPNTNITIGRSGNGKNTTVHSINIKNPSSSAADPSHNTDGFPIWTQYVNIYDCEIDTGDDNIVCDQDAQYVHVWNCQLKAGHGASFGSYTTNMHDIIYEDLTFMGTDCGFRLKSNRDRSGDVYNIVFRNCNMYNVASPFSITSWYDKLPDSPKTTAAAPDALIATTPRFHDILFQNVYVSGHTSYKGSDKNYYGIFIYGRPESKVKNVTFDNVQIIHSKGIKMDFCEGIKFLDNCTFEVRNTNKTAKNAVATTNLENVMEEKYESSYSWREEVGVMNMIFNKESYKSSSMSGGVTSYNFKNGCNITNMSAKTWGTGNYNTAKYSKDVEYTINIPKGKAVSSITFAGYSNSDDGDCWLANLNGTNYSEDKYHFVTRKNGATTIYTLTFEKPVTRTLTFIPGGNQACWDIRFTAEPSYLRGDANDDGKIDMTDANFVVAYILGTLVDELNLENADANLDGEIGMPDIMFIVNYILNGKFPNE